MLDQDDGNDEPIWTDNTAWVAVYAVPACNEGWHVYADHISADCKDLRVLRLSVAGKTWSAGEAIQAASIVSRLVLAESK